MKKLIAFMLCLGITCFPTTSNICKATDPIKTIESQQNEVVEIKDFTISNDKSLLQLDRVKDLHKQLYWAKNWSDEKIQKNIDNSQIVVGLYDKDNIQIGFARAVTDYSTVCYILDVVIDENHRNQGLGTKLMKNILNNEELKDCSFVLATSVQARSFYKRLGFQIKNDKYMLYRVS